MITKFQSSQIDKIRFWILCWFDPNWPTPLSPLPALRWRGWIYKFTIPGN